MRAQYRSGNTNNGDVGRGGVGPAERELAADGDSGGALVNGHVVAAEVEEERLPLGKQLSLLGLQLENAQFRHDGSPSSFLITGIAQLQIPETAGKPGNDQKGNSVRAAV